MVKALFATLSLFVFTTLHAAPKPSVAYKFAAVYAGKYVAEDGSDVKLAKQLLMEAAKRFKVNEETVFDLVTLGLNESRKLGFGYDMFDVAEALPVLDPCPSTNRKRMNQLLAQYLVSRKEGQNHSEALVGVRGLHLVLQRETKGQSCTQDGSI